MKLDDILTDPNNVRSDIDCTDLVASMKALIDAGCEPIIQPLVVDVEGVLIAGHRRLAALKKINWKGDVPTHVIEKGNTTAYQLHENTVRKGLELGDEVRVYTKLAKQGMKVGEIAKATMQKNQRVQQLLKLGELPDEAIVLMNEGRMNLTVAEYLTRFPKNAILDVLDPFKKSGEVSFYHVKSQLGAKEIDPSKALFDLKANNIRIVKDLFGDNDYLHPDDVEKYCELQRAAVVAVKDKALQEGGVIWLEKNKTTWDLQGKYIGPEYHRELAKEPAKKIKELEKKRNELTHSDDWNEDEIDKIDQEMDAIRDKAENYKPFKTDNLIHVMRVAEDGLSIQDFGWFHKLQPKEKGKPGEAAKPEDANETAKVVAQRNHMLHYIAAYGASIAGGTHRDVVDENENIWKEGLGMIAAAFYWKLPKLYNVWTPISPKDKEGLVFSDKFNSHAADGGLLDLKVRKELSKIKFFIDLSDYFEQHPSEAVAVILEAMVTARVEGFFDYCLNTGLGNEGLMNAVSRSLAPAYYASQTKEELLQLAISRKQKGKADKMNKKELVELAVSSMTDKDILPHLPKQGATPEIFPSWANVDDEDTNESD